jgi:hypothetical protein
MGKAHIGQGGALLLLAWLAGCGDTQGTFARLLFSGTVSSAAPIQSIVVDLRLGAKTATATFQAPQGAITLPTDAALRIVEGEGLLLITARALSAEGMILGTGLGQGVVVKDETEEIAVVFGGDRPDASDADGLDAGDDAGAGDTDGPAGDGADPGDAGQPDRGAVPDSGLDAGVDAALDTGVDAARDTPVDPPVVDAASPPVELLLAPGLAEFPIVDVGATGSREFTLTNGGQVAVAPPTLALSGSPAFTLAADSCSGVPLAAQGRCVFTVTFAPTVFGPASATVGVEAPLARAAASALTGVGRDYVTLTVRFAGTGAGQVTGPGLSCPSDGACSLRLPRTDPASTATLTLAASPAAGAVFAGWSGACVGTAGCEVSAMAPSTVTATFNATTPEYTLTITKVGTGSGTVTSQPAGIDCGPTCAARFTAGTTVAVTAVPAPGSRFLGFGGGECSSGTATCTASLTGSLGMTATFVTDAFSCSILPNVLYCNGPGGAEEFNLGALSATACQEGCAGEFAKAGLTGCWIAAPNGSCYCRAGGTLEFASSGAQGRYGGVCPAN